MGRNRPKFSFPVPGRKSNKKGDPQDDHTFRAPLAPPATQWPSRREESTNKAHRILGTSDSIYRPASRQTSIPASPSYMSVTVSDVSLSSEVGDRTSATPTDYSSYQKKSSMSKRASSNILHRTFTTDATQDSDNGSTTHRLQPQTSQSTMRSYYDAKSSPLAISQQTSDSAVRDMALRRGKPRVLVERGYTGHVASPMSPGILDEAKKKEQRKSKPHLLDMSKLFPKPKAGDPQNHVNPLLSPEKLVHSPIAVSTRSEYFPRPMTREPTPQPNGQIKIQSTVQKHTSMPVAPNSPVRRFKRDTYDNAKIHVRRPPKGVKHWFDALDEDSDEISGEATNRQIHTPKAVRPNGVKVPARKTSLGRLLDDELDRRSPQPPPSRFLLPSHSKDSFSHEDLVDVRQSVSPSQFSLHSQASVASTKTKESGISSNNLLNSSVLSFSSSEDETDTDRSRSRKFAVRKSLDINNDDGDVVIGRAQAFEVRPNRRPSAGKISMRSISTNAATIEVMYTPEPAYFPFNNPKGTSYTSGSRRSSHVRQPSIIHEDEDDRPQTATHMPMSPSSYSIRSMRTSTSEPKPRSNHHKLMAVTPEEEALLELMRKKRAAMTKSGSSSPIESPEQKDKLQGSSRRTSSFLPESSFVQAVDSKASRRAPAMTPTPLLLPPRGRSIKPVHDRGSHARDSSATSEAWSDYHVSPGSRTTLPHHIPTPSEFSPLDPFPPASLTPPASITSPTTTDRASPLPSPMTPGLPTDEPAVPVKVASSETSNEGDDIPVLSTSVIDGATGVATKSDTSTHRRRRTASSGTDISFALPAPLATVSESSSRPLSIVEPPPPRLPRKQSKRGSALTLSTAGLPRSRQNSIVSAHSQLSAHSLASNYAHSHTHGHGYAVDKRSSRRVSRTSSVASYGSIKGSRNSVSEDVLAAWGSLGGTY